MTKLTNWTWPWLCRALWNPVDALDLRDKDDRPDHGKIVPWTLLVVAIVYHAVGIPFTWWELTALGSLAYGFAAWRTFLQARNVVGTFDASKVETLEDSVRRTITETRDTKLGIEPTQD